MKNQKFSHKTVIYHKNCNDGFFAALAAKIHPYWKDADYIAAQYGDSAPDVTNHDVLISDFSYKRDVMIDMHKQANRLTVLDHHKTAEKELNDLHFAKFDMNKSGAVMAWEYLYPDTAIPDLYLYVQDRDLWRHQLVHTRHINAAISSYDHDFDFWSRVVDGDQKEFMNSLLFHGSVILRYKNKEVEKAVATWKKNKTMVSIGGYQVPVFNCTMMQSEVCGELAKDQCFAAVYTRTSEGYIFQLRERNSGVDVGMVASSYGGGGHASASGFFISHDNAADQFGMK